MNLTKKGLASALAAIFVFCTFTGCGTDSFYYTDDGKIHYPGEINIVLSDDRITANNKTVYSTISNIYTSHDVVYYEDRDFYDNGYPYGAGTSSDKHTSEEAEKITVVNITNAGTYRISGKLSNGQIRVDLSKRARNNANAVVNLVLDGVDINCDIAPAIIFKNVYECETGTHRADFSSEADTSAAGANIIIADGSVNNINGSHVAKIFKDKDGEKKKWKQDGAIYSYMSLNINGEAENSGILNVTADFEGISTEKHITVNGGNINIIAQNDGINVNFDYSVATINGGNLNILAGLSEDGGDGIDSNGWIVVNGGTTVSIGVRSTDSGIDDERSCYLNGGTLISYGSHIDWAELDSKQTSINLQFKEETRMSKAIVITDSNDKVIFAFDPSRNDIFNPYRFRRKGIVISSPQFNVGESYNLYIGGEIYGEEHCGIYDTDSIEGFENSTQQGYYKYRQLVHGGYKADEDKTFTPNTSFVMEDVVAGFVYVTDAYAD